jgi:hypothetical protein
MDEVFLGFGVLERVWGYSEGDSMLNIKIYGVLELLGE